MHGEEFLRRFDEPINARFWDNRLLNHSALLGVPHGLSVQDAKNMLAGVMDRLPQQQDFRVAILGLTPQLIDVCNAETRVKEVVPIDQTQVKYEFGGKIKRFRANWLEFKAEYGFDAILGDEALNNLSIQQYPHFFRAMHGCLRSHGTLVLRTLGRYEGAERFLEIPSDVLLKEIQSMQPNKGTADHGARILEVLHSVHIAFDPGKSSIETSRYNGQIRTWVEQKLITSEQAEPFWFPYYLSPELQLSSPTPDHIQEASREFFDPMRMMSVDPTYCGSNGLLASIYRITPFVVRS
jgi:hypothetical protein